MSTAARRARTLALPFLLMLLLAGCSLGGKDASAPTPTSVPGTAAPLQTAAVLPATATAIAQALSTLTAAAPPAVATVQAAVATAVSAAATPLPPTATAVPATSAPAVAPPAASTLPPATSTPAPSVANLTASLGASCSSSSRNGVQSSTVTLITSAQASGAFLQRVRLLQDDATVFDSGDLSAASQAGFQRTTSVPGTAGAHSVRLLVDAVGGGSIEKDGTITISGTSCNVQTR